MNKEKFSCYAKISFVFLAQTQHDKQCDEVAANVHGHQGPYARVQVLWEVHLSKWIALLPELRGVHARQLQVCVLIPDECLEPILENGKVLELLEEPWDVVLVHEEASEEHEWNDEDGSERDGKLLVGEDCSKDECVAAGRVEDQEDDQLCLKDMGDQ